MSRLTDLIRETKDRDPDLGAELEREFSALAGRRAFGLNFERHRPEAVELPQRPVRRGDKVRVLPERGSTEKGDQRLWRVAKIRKVKGDRLADLELLDDPEETVDGHSADDLVVVAEFRDPIYPGLAHTGRVQRGGPEKPAHTVINGENFHVLKALTYTHRGKVDCIYIDPPYNTGAKDWKYNNDYVEGDDLYRHSKWLAFMERRLLLAKELLNPEDSVVIVAIDEKEYLRLGLLLEQTFPEARIQMVTTVTNVRAVARTSEYSRTSEFVYFVKLGLSAPAPQELSSEWSSGSGKSSKSVRGKVHWQPLRRLGLRGNVKRSDRPNMFYPLFVKTDGSGIHSVGQPIPLDAEPSDDAPAGTVAVWPIRANGEDGYWQISADKLPSLIKRGFVRASKPKPGSIAYLKAGERKKFDTGVYRELGRADDGSVVAEVSDEAAQTKFLPGDVWNLPAHDAGVHGTRLLASLLPDRTFPFPKSLYAVEDALRFFLSRNPEAVVLDFFSGSGTTAHAVMRLNRQDDGRRQCISVTNNEVSADEQRALRAENLRPGDSSWESHGICDHITKPRIEAAITGKTPDGEPIKGDYKFTDEFPIAEGFEENAEFFTLTYEAPMAVGHNRAFERVSPLLWLRAGAVGEQIQGLPKHGWTVTVSHGLLVDLDATDGFCAAIAKSESVRVAYVVTDDDRRFQSIARQLPSGVEPVRLYESYLTNFRFVSGE